MMVGVTDIPAVELDDEVVLPGHQGEEEISTDQFASMCGTITTGLSPGLIGKSRGWRWNEIFGVLEF